MPPCHAQSQVPADPYVVRYGCDRAEISSVQRQPGAPSSAGSEAGLAAYGSTNASSNQVRLVASPVPMNQFGFFITARHTGFVPNPGGSDGNLCLGGGLGRLVGSGQIQNAGPEGRLVLDVDIGNLPLPPYGVVPAMAGEDWYFQGWFRDVATVTGGPNFTEAIRGDKDRLPLRAGQGWEEVPARATPTASLPLFARRGRVDP